jgi:aryl-alcohol dehydrogenase-like predicted oxidoreductase
MGLINKMGLGTVQFGLNYGISNKKGKTDNNEIKSIINTCQSKGMTIIDTSPDYGNAEELIGKFDLGKFKVVSKFISKPNYSIHDLLKKSLKNLNLNNLYGYLSHKPQELLSDSNLWMDLLKIKDQGLVNKIGFSVYHPNEIELLIEKKMVPDIVQLPFNFLDRRFENHFQKLIDLDVEIHARSIFLQGLFFLNTKNMNSFFDPVKNIIDELQKSSNLSGDLLNFVLSNKYISHGIVGVENNNQLKHNIKSCKYSSEINVNINTPYTDDILNPTKWKN